MNAILALMLVMLGAVAGLVWMTPEALRYLAARLWARAHAVEVGRRADQGMLAKISEGDK
jgi:hypothetical protein